MRIGLFGSTAIAGSFCGAPAASTFTVTAGGATDVPSSGLESTYVGVIGANGPGAATASLASASSSRNADTRRYNPSVARTDATLPASVVMSNVGEEDPATANVGTPTAINAKPTISNTTGEAYLIAFPHCLAPYRRAALNRVAVGRSYGRTFKRTRSMSASGVGPCATPTQASRSGTWIDRSPSIATPLGWSTSAATQSRRPAGKSLP